MFINIITYRAPIFSVWECSRFHTFREIRARFQNDSDWSEMDFELSHFCEMHALWSVVMPRLATAYDTAVLRVKEPSWPGFRALLAHGDPPVQLAAEVH